jgi:hypothetical protein
VKSGRSPLRTCLGCGARDKKESLLRLVATDGRRLKLDLQGRYQGRGGYLHRDQECWEGFRRKKSLYRALRVEIDKEARDRFIAELRALSTE